MFKKKNKGGGRLGAEVGVINNIINIPDREHRHRCEINNLQKLGMD